MILAGAINKSCLQVIAYIRLSWRVDWVGLNRCLIETLADAIDELPSHTYFRLVLWSVWPWLLRLIAC